jgi:hypothetical protein
MILLLFDNQSKHSMPGNPPMGANLNDEDKPD